MDGAYIQPQLKAFKEAGITHTFIGLTNSASHLIGQVKNEWKDAGTLFDAARSGLTLRYEDSSEWTISNGMTEPAEQFNLIGYSYGSLLAAQTANSYAKKGHIVNHLVLIGSPIYKDFLNKLKQQKNIKKVVVIDLIQHGDPIYAGMSQIDLVSAAPTLATQMSAGKGEGHFYYAHVVTESKNRWKDLAERLFNAGLR